MKASETQLRSLFTDYKTQFIIPVYQRNYDWSNIECKQLLDDIRSAGSASTINSHFIGSIVYIMDSHHNTGDIKEKTIIDGQQRITTITLIYLVLYHLARERNLWRILPGRRKLQIPRYAHQAI